MLEKAGVPADLERDNSSIRLIGIFLVIVNAIPSLWPIWGLMTFTLITYAFSSNSPQPIPAFAPEYGGRGGVKEKNIQYDSEKLMHLINN